MIREAIPQNKNQTKSCKRCLKVAVCAAYESACDTNTYFAGIPYLELKKPLIERPDSLAEYCKEYCPPDSKLFQPATLVDSSELV